MIKSLEVSQAVQLIEAGRVDVIDVREETEWRSGHIPGARLVPLDRLRQDPEAALVRDNVVFVCAKGVRSLTAAKVAERLGLQQLYNLEGGNQRLGARRSPVGCGRVMRAALEDVHPVRYSAESGSDHESGEPDEPSEASIGRVVGAQLRRLRVRRGLSLERLSRASSVSRAMLGQIELAKSVPSIVVLWKIARALGVPISEILTGDTVPTARVLRRGESRSVTSLGGGLVARSLLSDVDSRRCAFYELSLAAHATEPASAQERGTRVNLVVANGGLDLTLGRDRFQLSLGDAIAFDASVAHAYTNPHAAECRAYLVSWRRDDGE